MKKLILFLLLIWSASLFAQESNNVSVFHRLLIYNQKQELLIAKFKDTDIWVTPGFYQDSLQFIKEGLQDVASTYGITVSTPELQGMFSMRSETSTKTVLSVRNIYSCNYVNGQLKVPSFLGEVKWIPMETALQTLTYPHINLFIKQTFDYPNTVWGGSIVRYQASGKWKTKVMEAFYPLFSSQTE